MTENPAAQNAETSSPESVAREESHVLRERREKAERMAEAGIPLYASRFAPSHSVAAVRAEADALQESGDKVVLAGRVLLVRVMGKAGFFTFCDETGSFQAYVKRDATDEAGFALFKKHLDIGDIVGIEGKIFTAKKGELTIEAEKLTLLTKSLRPLPEKWHGLRDVDQRYRQRYVDLIVNPEVRETFRHRSALISALRRRLDERGYMEVETPMMQTIYGGAAARPFRTHLNALDLDLYLRIAPELFLKRLLVGGFERVYEINRNFRNEGLSTRHNPEFTMLELYTAWWDYTQTMDLTEELIRETTRDVLGSTKIRYQGREIDFAQPFAREEMLTLIARALRLQEDNNALSWNMPSPAAVLEIVSPQLTAMPFPEGVSPESVKTGIQEAETADEALMFLFEELVEPTLVEPTFVYDFPKSLCPLAKSSEKRPEVAERFELFCGNLELANAYSEMNDPVEQLEKFREQVERRRAGDEEAMSEIDMDYIHALEYGMPPASGLGIGIDRLVMLLTDSPAIRDVILFPLMRPLPSGARS